MHKNINLSGVPLGGIGAGKVEFCPDGAFRNLTWHNNMDAVVFNRDMTQNFAEEGLEGCFIAAFVEGVGACALKEKDRYAAKTQEKGGISYNGRFPFVNCNYPDMDGVKISLEAFSSLQLDGNTDISNSCLPAACFTLTATNMSSHARYVSFAFNWDNLIGLGGYPSAVVSDKRGNTINSISNEKCTALYYSHDTPKMDKRLDGNYTLALYPSKGMESSYMIWTPNLFNVADKKTMWERFSTAGRLPDMKVPQIYGDTNIFGTLAGGRQLDPGETTEAVFILSWYFPNHTANGQQEIIYKNPYAIQFKDSSEISHYFYEHKQGLLEGTKQWHARLDASNLPDWLKMKLSNDLFPLYSNTFYSSDGRFSVNEAPTDMLGCMGTIDQRAASSSIYEMCFPALGKSELLLFSRQQIDEDHERRYGSHWDTVTGTFGKTIDRLGAIRHDVGWDNLEGGYLGNKLWTSLHWPDIPAVYVLQIYQHASWTGDLDFFNEVYPCVKLAVRFMEELDQDGDGVAELWGPGCSTYDNDHFPYYGVSPFIATLYMAAYKAAGRMAAYAGDKQFDKKMTDLALKVGKTIDQKLWSEELGYYYAWSDPNYKAWQDGERPHIGQSKNCMAAQLAGVWYASLLNLGSLLDKNKVYSALSAVSDRNVKTMKFCAANETSEDGSFKSNSWPFYIQNYFSSNLLYNGNADDGLEAFEKFYQAVYENTGSPWDVPLVWEGEENGERGWGRWYMSNTSSWYILNALGGFNYNALDKELMLKPNIPSVMGELKDLPVFSPLFHGRINTSDGNVSLKIDRGEELHMETLVTEKKYRQLYLNAQEVSLPLILKRDDCLDIIFN